VPTPMPRSRAVLHWFPITFAENEMSGGTGVKGTKSPVPPGRILLSQGRPIQTGPTIDGDRHGVPLLVRAPQCGQRCMGNLPCNGVDPRISVDPLPAACTSAVARSSKRLAREIKRTTRFVTTSGRKPPWSFPCPSRPAAPGQRVKERTRE